MLGPAALDQLFRSARSTHSFTPQPVTDETIRELYELLKWGPTAWNSQPGRYVFVRSSEAKARLHLDARRGERISGRLQWRADDLRTVALRDRLDFRKIARGSNLAEQPFDATR